MEVYHRQFDVSHEVLVTHLRTMHHCFFCNRVSEFFSDPQPLAAASDRDSAMPYSLRILSATG